MGNLDHPEDHRVSRAANVKGQFDVRSVNSPDVRWEKVQSLRRAIASGEYRPSARVIAEAMLREARNNLRD